MTDTVCNESSQHRTRSSAVPCMSPDSSMPLKSTALGHKNSLALSNLPSCSSHHYGGPGELVLPRYFLLGRALVLQGQSERVGRVSRQLSPFTTPSPSRSVSDTIESAFEVALSSVLELDDHDRTSTVDVDVDIDVAEDNDDTDDQRIRKYRRELLKDDMGLFLDRLSTMRNEVQDDDSDSESSDEDDDVFSNFCY